jgi:hypothetical protein
VIARTYYKKHGRSTNTYVFLEMSTVAHMDAHLVRACKFPWLWLHTLFGITVLCIECLIRPRMPSTRRYRFGGQINSDFSASCLCSFLEHSCDDFGTLWYHFVLFN